MFKDGCCRKDVDGKKLFCYCRCLCGIGCAIVFLLVFGFVVQALWNWLIPDIFKVGTIGYAQALGLIVLARLLFGGIGHRHGHRHGWYRGWGHMSGSCCGNEENGTFESWWVEEGKEAYKKYAESKKEGSAPPR